jgi:hypothetical protein
MFPGCSQNHTAGSRQSRFSNLYSVSLSGAVGARTHDRRIMRSTAFASYAPPARIPRSRAADGPDCTVCTDGSVHEPVHAFHRDHRMPTTERYRRQRGLMLWARPGASRSSGRRQGRRYRDRVDSQGRCRCTFIAPTMLADGGHVACSTVYEAWIRLRDLVNLYLAGAVPDPGLHASARLAMVQRPSAGSI